VLFCLIQETGNGNRIESIVNTQTPVYNLRFPVLTTASMKMTAFWDNAPCSLVDVLMMETVCTSETSVNFCETTQRNITEAVIFSAEFNPHIRRKEDVPSLRYCNVMMNRQRSACKDLHQGVGNLRHAGRIRPVICARN
jgi:hypothetical protein